MRCTTTGTNVYAKIMKTFLLLDVYPSFTMGSALILCRRKGDLTGFDFIPISKKDFLMRKTKSSL